MEDLSKQDENKVKNFIIKHYAEHKIMPTEFEVIIETGFSTRKVKIALHELKKQGFLKSTNKPNLVSEHKYKKQFKKLPKITFILVLIFVFLLISIGASILSTYITSQWIQTFIQGPLGLLMALLIVCFIAFSAPVIMLILENKILGIIPALGYGIIWIVVIAFSMLSTIAVQFDKYEEIESQENVSKVDATVHKTGYDEMQQSIDKIDITIAEERIRVEERRISISELREKRAIIYIDYESYAKALLQISSTEEQDRYNNMAWRKRQAENKLAAIENDIEVIRKKIEEILANIKVLEEEQNVLKESAQDYLNENSQAIVLEKTEILTFAKWLSRLLDYIIEYNTIDFLMIIIPALFIDIAAPLGLSIVTMLLKRRRQYGK